MDIDTIDSLYGLGCALIMVAAIASLIRSNYSYVANDQCSRGCGEGRGEGSNVCSTNSATGVCNAKQAAKLV